MANLGKENTFKSFMYSRVSIFILAVVSVFLVLSVFSIFEKREEARKQSLLSKERLIDLEKRKETLSKDIEHINNEEGMEDLLRDRYNVVKQGEEVVVIVDEDESGINSESSNSRSSFWQKILNFLQ